MKPRRRRDQFLRPRIVLALRAAMDGKDWARVADLITILEADAGGPIDFEGDPLERIESSRAAAAALARIARAIRAGKDPAGCGDPECDGCSDEPIAPPRPPERQFRVRYQDGSVEVLDRPPAVLPFPFVMMPLPTETPC